MHVEPLPLSRRRIVALAVLLFATVFARGLQVASALMPFEGWDEYQHIAVADFVAREGHMPTRKDRVLPGLWPLLRAHPHPESGAKQLGGLGATRYDGKIWSRKAWVVPDPGTVYDRPPLLYQAQHGPLYYRFLALLARAPGMRDPLTWIDAARLANVVFTAWSVVGWFVLLTLVYRRGAVVLMPAAVCVAVAANPLYLFNGARVANDALAILLATVTLLVYVVALDRAGIARGMRPFALAAAVGLLTALTVLTKAIGLALLPLFAVALPWVMRSRGRSFAVAAGVLASFVLSYAALAGPWHYRNLAEHGTLTSMQESVRNREQGRSVTAMAGEIPGIVLRTVRKQFVLQQFYVGGWSFVDGTGGLRRAHRWLIRTGLLLGLFACARRDSRRRLFELVRARPELPLLLLSLWAALMHHAFQTQLAHGWVGTNAWYTALVLPVLVLLILAGAWSLPWRPGGPLLALGLTAVWAAAQYRAMFTTLIPLESGTDQLTEGVQRIAAHHAFLTAGGPGMLWLGAALSAATVGVALARSRTAGR